MLGTSQTARFLVRLNPPNHTGVVQRLEPLPLTESPPVRTLPPWQYEQMVAPAVRRTNRSGTFTRMVPLDPARLDALPTWWRQHARGEHVDIASRLFLGEPHPE